MKNQGLNSLNKFAKPVDVKQEEVENKKVDWAKMILLIYKILEPEIKKAPRIYVLIPVSFLWFMVYGGYKTLILLSNLF